MANRYWTITTGDTWNATAGSKWSLTSGGAGGQAVPTASDDVFFDANSGANTITISGNRVCKSLNTTNYTGTIAGTATPTLTISGNLTFGSSTINNLAGTITINSASTVTTNGISIFDLNLAGTSTITNNSLLTVTNNLKYNLGSVITMSGTSPWIATNFYILTSNNISHKLVAGLEYIVTTYFESTATTNALKDSLVSLTPGVKSLFTLQYPATQNVGFTNSVDIDSSRGQTIWTFNGVVSASTNWNVFVNSINNNSFII